MRPRLRMTTPIARGTPRDTRVVASRLPQARHLTERWQLRRRSRRRSIRRPRVKCANPVSFICPADSLAIVPQDWNERGQHHRQHHDDRHAEERRRGAGPCLSRHPHPCHRHRPVTRHQHLAHRRHGRGPDDRDQCAGHEEQHRNAEEDMLRIITLHLSSAVQSLASSPRRVRRGS